MNIFTPTVRSSLLSDAKKGASLRRWSIRDLIDFRLDGTSAVENTKSLLQEMQIRLAVQHGRLSASSKSIEEYAQVAKLEGEMAQRSLKKMRQLHENTYSLPYQIIDGDGQALLQNFSKPNKKYVSGMFDEIMSRHGTSVETLADAVIHTRNMEERLPWILTRNFSEAEMLRNESIESFLHSRLLIQLLCDHYISLNKGKPTGAVSLGADVVDVVDDAVTEAKHVCDANLGVAPEVHIQQNISQDFSPPPLIRSWLHHAIVEVTKNAMTSNIERWSYKKQSLESIPPSVYINVGEEMVGGSLNPGFLSIEIMDQGTGLKDKERAFGFAQTASQKRWDRLQEQQSYAAVRQPLGSLGVGLPLSRLMLRAFGGDLVVSNHEEGRDIDSGCTATLRINYDDTYTAKN
mmetsp:Transcript_21149/g.38814  ORF Transcript_21149/g.38814 Transcript_21149/m.38814 type:complete len:404 (-) Transcript_21149:91-1302(-)|eukprot:CAMPEP_0201990938 /NCGR_PEP_ID=MMETSP0904-20121228/93636_1 /ASSEMBLY_ACC=CAM_ASM_000553 /TAXON_ID=420261 /ORGANISM="Thalassiosira antarctica, Strain CCMP982" /LENGTH=403 /DNA_ID=CAMNT_0048545227 /DNA_START=1 /DNA_END=1212 /DNA_ORIENTATION=+